MKNIVSKSEKCGWTMIEENEEDESICAITVYDHCDLFDGL